MPKPPDAPIPAKPPTIAQRRGVAGPDQRRGRPSKLTPKVRRIIFESLARGNYLSTAADLARVSRQQVHEWVARGEREVAGLYHDFAVGLRQVLGGVEDNLVGVFQAGAENDPQIAKEFLARRWAQKWGAKANGPADATPGLIVPLTIVFRTLPPGYDPIAAEKAAAIEAEGGVVEPTPLTSGQGSLEGFVEPRVAEPPPVRVPPRR